jgi:hypothetical protein
VPADRYDLPLSTVSGAGATPTFRAGDLALSLYPGVVEAFDGAIAVDPGFVMTHAGKAQVLVRAAARAAPSAATEVAMVCRRARTIQLLQQPGPTTCLVPRTSVWPGYRSHLSSP